MSHYYSQEVADAVHEITRDVVSNPQPLTLEDAKRLFSGIALNLTADVTSILKDREIYQNRIASFNHGIYETQR